MVNKHLNQSFRFAHFSKLVNLFEEFFGVSPKPTSFLGVRLGQFFPKQSTDPLQRGLMRWLCIFGVILRCFAEQIIQKRSSDMSAEPSTKYPHTGPFSLLDAETIQGIKYACTAMWPAYLKVLRERAKGTMNILDRFHIMKKFSEALDRVRADETRQLLRDGYEPVLTKSCWCILKKRENLTETQTVRLNELLKYNLRTTKAYLMREDFNRLWTYSSPAWASKFLRDWCTRANRSGIEPMKRMAKMLERHESLLLNWFEARGLSSGIFEGFNNKAKLTVRKSYGF